MVNPKQSSRASPPYSHLHDMQDSTAYTSSYNRHRAHATPSRIPRASLPSPPSASSAVSTASPSHQDSKSSFPSGSRKRARPMSPSAVSLAPSYNASPYTPSGWSHVTANHIGSPPPMVNSNYDLAGGMDTPTVAAEKRYDAASDLFDLDGRLSRDWRTTKENYRELGETVPQLGGERNGGRYAEEDIVMSGQQHPPQQGSGWGTLVLGAIGGVVAGAWAFCKKSAFRGFYAGGGQGYAVRRPNEGDPFGHESMWEDEQDAPRNMSDSLRSFERLATPVPGEYPEDSPPEDNISGHNHVRQHLEAERRPAKRRQTDGGGWVVVDKVSRSRGNSPRISTPSVPRTSQPRHHSNSFKRPILAASRSRHRLSGVSNLGSPAPPSHSRHASYSHQRSPSSGTNAQKSSPPSVEAKKYAARMRREEKATGERYDKLNDQLMAMIKQGKEALGSKVEVVDADNEQLW